MDTMYFTAVIYTVYHMYSLEDLPSTGAVFHGKMFAEVSLCKEKSKNNIM